MKRTLRLTETDLARIVKRVVNEQMEPELQTTGKTSEILPKYYNSVKQMIQSTIDKGGTVTITITGGKTKLTGIVEGNTGTIPTQDLKNIIP